MRLHALTSGGRGLDARDAARFQVPDAATRHAEAAAFAARQDAPRSGRSRRTAGFDERVSRPPSSRSDRKHAALTTSARDWLAERDRERVARREAARDRVTPVAAAVDAGRPAAGRSNGRLREQRDGVPHLLPGTGKEPGRQPRAASPVDRDWDERSMRISGAFDRIGSYAAQRARRLGLETGGSGDLNERTARALARLREERDRAARDEAARHRALQRRREREAEG